MTEPIIISRDNNDNNMNISPRPGSVKSAEVLDRYDQIYARYSRHNFERRGSSDDDQMVAPNAEYVGGTSSMSNNNNNLPPTISIPPTSSSTVTSVTRSDPVGIQSSALPHNGDQFITMGTIDPPEEEFEPATTKWTYSPKHYQDNSSRSSYEYTSPMNTTTEYYSKALLPNKYSTSSNQATIDHHDYYYSNGNYHGNYNGSHSTTVASRDDDEYDAGNNGGSSSNVSVNNSSYSYSRNLNHGSTREDIHSKIDALNAKSRALRGITYSHPQSLTYSSSFVPVEETSYEYVPSTTSTSSSYYTGNHSSSYNNAPPPPSFDSYQLSSTSTSALLSPFSTTPSIISSGGNYANSNKYITSFPSENSVMSNSSNATHTTTATVPLLSPSLMSPGKYSKNSTTTATATTDSIDSRLEYLTKQSMEFRKRAERTIMAGIDAVGGGGGGGGSDAATPVPLTNNSKRVTFESDYITGATINKDDRSVYSLDERGGYKTNTYSGAAEEKVFVDSINAAHTTTAPSGTAIKTSGAASVTSTTSSLPSSGSIATNTTASTAANKANKIVKDNIATNHPPKALAMKILSEKILDGYTMTRNHCPKCNMTLLCQDATTTSNNKKPISFHADGTLDMASLDKNNLRRPKEECVYCPVDKLRKSISRGVCKRVMAGKLLCGLETGTSASGTGGRRILCKSCHSPTLISKYGTTMTTTMDCQVCLVLDAACIGIVREQGRGGVLREFRLCNECDSPQLELEGGSTKCVVCDVVNAWLRKEEDEEHSPWRQGAMLSIASDGVTSLGGSVVGGVLAASSSAGLGITTEASVLSDASSSLPQSFLAARTVAAASVVSDTSGSLPQEVPAFASQPPGEAKSPSQLPAMNKSPSQQHGPNTSSSILASLPPTKSTVHPLLDLGNIEYIARIDFVKLQEQIQAELAKVVIEPSQIGSLSMGLPVLSCQPIANVKSACNPILDQDIVKSASIMSGDSPLADELAKLQAAVVKGPSILKSRSDDGSPSIDLETLQSQLKTELEKAKRSQLILECTIEQTSNGNTDASTKSCEKLKAELEVTKQTQLALIKIIEDSAMSINKSSIENSNAKPSVPTGGNTDEIPAAAFVATTTTSHVHSFSISQQEVDATGNLKEYIPPPSYFSPNIPSEVLVYHVPEAEGDQSVAAQSHHTKNLKRSERDIPARQGCLFDCCCDSPADAHQHADYDFDTIETDDDYTVDYTLNTMDDSRLDYLRTMDEDNRSEVNGEKIEAREKSDNVDSRSRDVPQSSSGRCLFSCLGCGNNEVDDAYSMVSRRGIVVGEHQQPRQQREPPLLSNVIHHRQIRGEESGDRYMANPHGREESDCGSMCRVGEGIPKPLSSRASSDGTRSTLNHGKYIINDSDPNYVSRGMVANKHLQHTLTPSPPDTPEWGSINDSPNEGSDFDSVRRVRGGQPPPLRPKSSLRPSLANTQSPHFTKDHNSVQSDITDHSSASHRRVSFGSSSRRDINKLMEHQLQHQQELRALTEENNLSSENMGGRYSSSENASVLLSLAKSSMSNHRREIDVLSSSNGSQQY